MNHCQACIEATEAAVSSQYNFEVSRHVPYKIDVVRKKYIPSVYPSDITFLEISSGYDPLVGSFYHLLKLRLRVNCKMTISGIN